ncbi:hypothetical protein [Fibrella aestuarina]|uniref:hypothetical protein n=1 Tax=Fibrella aestuarina TaxID=651143 RepID=UPI00059C8F9A|nr:hypothetical protein [Fibrella aestuarina]
MEYKFGDKVISLLKEQGKTKKSLYLHLGMTANGFEQMLENNTFSAVRLAQIAAFLDVDVTHFYDLPVRQSEQVEASSYLKETLNRLEASFARQVEIKDSQIAGLQRTIDYLTGGGQLAQKSFNGPVAMTEDEPRVIKLNSKNKGLKTA